uniref:Uncharacterized protein n=1 Tax=Rangifer tarandus platyrhynchus TaxID=3082113 RepID=A0ACB0E5U8_RANTA|nr:unnamed protein product [Rangifer tarandus platyrhynchus]
MGFPAPRQRGGQPSRQAPRPPAHLARGAAGQPVSQPPLRQDAHLRGIPEPNESAGQNKNPTRLTQPGDSPPPPGARFLATPRKFRPLGLSARGSGRARSAGGASLPSPEARFPAGREPAPALPAASSLTSGKKLSIVPRALPNLPESGSQLSRKSMQPKVRGNHACQGATPRNSSPRGSPAAISVSPFSAFAPFVCPNPRLNASVPTAAFVSSGSKFLTPGRSARERRTAGAQGGQENSGHRASPGGSSPSSSAAAVRIRRPELTGSQSHRDSRTGAHGPPRPLVRARPLARIAPPSTEPRPPSRPTRGSLATPCPSGSPALSTPLPALPPG